MEVGDPQPNANLQAIDDIMRDLLDSQRVAIEKLGDKELRTFYENYFPHLWNKRAGNDPESIFRTIFAKRPAKARKPSSNSVNSHRCVAEMKDIPLAASTADVGWLLSDGIPALTR